MLLTANMVIIIVPCLQYHERPQEGARLKGRHSPPPRKKHFLLMRDLFLRGGLFSLYGGGGGLYCPPPHQLQKFLRTPMYSIKGSS